MHRLSLIATCSRIVNQRIASLRQQLRATFDHHLVDLLRNQFQLYLQQVLHPITRSHPHRIFDIGFITQIRDLDTHITRFNPFQVKLTVIIGGRMECVTWRNNRHHGPHKRTTTRSDLSLRREFKDESAYGAIGGLPSYRHQGANQEAHKHHVFEKGVQVSDDFAFTNLTGKPISCTQNGVNRSKDGVNRPFSANIIGVSVKKSSIYRTQG